MLRRFFVNIFLSLDKLKLLPMYFLCYCQNAKDVLYGLSDNERQSVEKKINELKSYTPKDLKAKFKYFGAGIYLIETGNAKIIIQAEQNIIFVREIFFGSRIDTFDKRYYLELKSGNWIKKNPLPEKEYKQCYEKINSIKQTSKTPPPEDLTDWIKDFELKLDFNVFEFPDWVDYTLNDSVDSGLDVADIKSFGFLLSDIANNKLDTSQNFIINGDLEIYEYQDRGLAIFYKSYQLDNRRVIIIFGGANINKQKEYYKKLKNKISNANFGKGINFQNLNDISRHAGRAYPIWTIKNAENIDNLWFPIEKNSELDNLALLSEQIDLLNNIREQLPIYIYGQAGSGKSTILYYVFANLYYLSLLNPVLQERMIFLSENQELLKRTKQIVRSMLLNNPHWNLNADDVKNLDKYFKTFRDFIIDLIPQKYKENFPEDKYLNFPLFKKLYFADHSLYRVRKDISPEEAWFTITTFIYGYDLEKIYLSDDYDNINKKFRKHIPKERYIRVEKEILPFYEKLINKDGYWDRLKAIKFINETLGFSPDYLAIICDESQDFSRAEIMFILRQLELSKYDLSDLDSLPLLFAGDQNQTVNPTGYRDDDIRAIIHNELNTIKFSGELHAFESRYNYRSIKQIVYLADIIQYYRNKVLSLKIERPQIPKRQDDITSNILFSYKFLQDKPSLKEDIKKRVKYKMFIIPADIFEKQEYLRKNSLLKELADTNDLIRTAVEAKGIDYKQVVIYGFGEYFIENFSDSLEFESSDENLAFIYKYFFNKLYVAITRAQNELIIIDSDRAWHNFWKKLINQDITDERWSFLNDEKGNLIIKDLDSSISLVKESKKENALEAAEKEMEMGQMEANPDRLKIAANLFYTYGETYKADYCYALSQEYLGNFQEAIKYYKKIGQLDKVSAILFSLQEFEKLASVDISLITDKKIHETRVILAKAIVQNDFYLTEIRQLRNNVQPLISILRSIQWTQDIIQLLLNSTKNKQDNWYKKIALEILWQISKEIKQPVEVVKEIASMAVDVEHLITIKILELYDLTNLLLYYKAKLKQAQENEDEPKIIFWNFRILLDFDKKREYLDQINRILSQSYDLVNKNDFILLAAQLTYLLTAFSRDNSEKLLELIQTIENTDQADSIYKSALDVAIYFNPHKLITTFIIERWAKQTYKQTREIDSINEFYKQVANKLQLDYQEFTESELEKLEPVISVPIEYPWHIRNLKIQNFRQFNMLEIQDIGQFNLIVGDNNAGKTSLLEALLINPDMKKTVQYLNYAFYRRNGLDFDMQNSGLQDFFLTNSRQILLTAREKRLIWNIEISRSGEQFFFNGEKINISELQTTTDIVPFIPFGRENLRRIARFYEQQIFVHTRKRREFQDMMKVFIPDIELISADSDGNIMIETKNSDQAIPLSYFGEGSYKMFHILIYLYYFKGQRIMIDEVDSGIYYAHFKEFWKTLIKLADKTNTQIFATTHNRECIEIFSQVLKDEEFTHYRERSRVITLYKFSENKFKAYTHNYEQFSFLIDNDYEIRGELL